MNFHVHGYTYNNKVKSKYLCPSHEGQNKSPPLSWESIPDAKSYALFMQDPDAPRGPFVHWYIPYISPEIIKIDSLAPPAINISPNAVLALQERPRIIQGYNHTGKYGYYGPCNPTSSPHRYIFTLFSLDAILQLNPKILSISSMDAFIQHLKKQKIRILHQESISFSY